MYTVFPILDEQWKWMEFEGSQSNYRTHVNEQNPSPRFCAYMGTYSNGQMRQGIADCGMHYRFICQVPKSM